MESLHWSRYIKVTKYPYLLLYYIGHHWFLCAIPLITNEGACVQALKLTGLILHFWIIPGRGLCWCPSPQSSYSLARLTTKLFIPRITGLLLILCLAPICGVIFIGYFKKNIQTSSLCYVRLSTWAEISDHFKLQVFIT